MNDLVSEVEEYLGPRLDCVFTYTLDRNEDTGVELLRLQVNKSGTVSQFVARTDLEESQIGEFIKKLERELK